MNWWSWTLVEEFRQSYKKLTSVPTSLQNCDAANSKLRINARSTIQLHEIRLWIRSGEDTNSNAK